MSIENQLVQTVGDHKKVPSYPCHVQLEEGVRRQVEGSLQWNHKDVLSRNQSEKNSSVFH